MDTYLLSSYVFDLGMLLLVSCAVMVVAAGAMVLAEDVWLQVESEPVEPGSASSHG